MAKFNFYLREPSSKSETPITLFINWKNNRLKYPTSVSILPKLWDSDKQIIIEKKGHPELSELNIKLTNLLASSKKALSKFENENQRPPSPSELKTAIKIENNENLDIVKKHTLLSYIDQFIEESENRTNLKTGKPISKGTILTYGQIRQSIKKYSLRHNKTIEFEDIDLDFYFSFRKFLTNEGLAINTLGKRIALLKTILKDATDRGVNKNLAFLSKQFSVPREKTDNIYLNEDELMEIYKLDLSNNKRLENVRDLFIIGCWTALRWSDLSKLTEKDIESGYIDIEAKKTRELVKIPVHYLVKQIILKHNGNLPKKITGQKMNEYVKELGSKIKSLHEFTSKKITKGGKETINILEKYKRITTHTMRRSFATNLYKDGISTFDIMKITGHTTEKSFYLYIKLSPKESADNILKHWDEKYKLKII